MCILSTQHRLLNTRRDLLYPRIVIHSVTTVDNRNSHKLKVQLNECTLAKLENCLFRTKIR